MERVDLGVGVLDWHPLERVSDRYGSIFLTEGTLEDQRLIDLEGTFGTLIAEVVATRKSSHR